MLKNYAGFIRILHQKTMRPMPPTAPLMPILKTTMLLSAALFTATEARKHTGITNVTALILCLLRQKCLQELLFQFAEERIKNMYDFKLLDKKLDEFLKLGIPFYDCKVMKNGECVYRKKNGFTDNSKTLKPTGEEIYNIYSCSKLITCTGALMLIERGMLSPEDELCKYLPEFSEMNIKTENGVKKAENKIKIKQQSDNPKSITLLFLLF